MSEMVMLAIEEESIILAEAAAASSAKDWQHADSSMSERESNVPHSNIAPKSATSRAVTRFLDGFVT